MQNDQINMFEKINFKIINFLYHFHSFLYFHTTELDHDFREHDQFGQSAT